MSFWLGLELFSSVISISLVHVAMVAYVTALQNASAMGATWTYHGANIQHPLFPAIRKRRSAGAALRGVRKVMGSEL